MGAWKKRDGLSSADPQDGRRRLDSNSGQGGRRQTLTRVVRGSFLRRTTCACSSRLDRRLRTGAGGIRLQRKWPRSRRLTLRPGPPHLLSGCIALAGLRTAVRAAASQLTVVVDDGAGGTSTWTLTCDPTGGDHPDAEQACAAIEGHRSALNPVPKDRMCAQVYGGPREGHDHRHLAWRADLRRPVADQRLRDRSVGRAGAAGPVRRPVAVASGGVLSDRPPPGAGSV